MWVCSEFRTFLDCNILNILIYHNNAQLVLAERWKCSQPVLMRSGITPSHTHPQPRAPQAQKLWVHQGHFSVQFQEGDSGTLHASHVLPTFWLSPNPRFSHSYRHVESAPWIIILPPCHLPVPQFIRVNDERVGEAIWLFFMVPKLPTGQDLVTHFSFPCASHKRHFSITACLVPICSLHGVAITTVEGVGSIKTRLHAVQVSAFPTYLILHFIFSTSVGFLSSLKFLSCG